MSVTTEEDGIETDKSQKEDTSHAEQQETTEHQYNNTAATNAIRAHTSMQVTQSDKHSHEEKQ